MKRDLTENIKKELIYLACLFFVIAIAFKIVFYKEGIIVVLRILFALFWIFVLPGYAVMLYWNEKLEFIERFIIGIAISAAVIGSASYYLGLLGLNIKYHGAILPLVLLCVGAAIAIKKK